MLSYPVSSLIRPVEVQISDWTVFLHVLLRAPACARSRLRDADGQQDENVCGNSFVIVVQQMAPETSALR